MIKNRILGFLVGSKKGDLSVQADDICQEVIIKIIKNKDKFIGDKKDFVKRAYTVTSNMFYDYYRKVTSLKGAVHSKSTLDNDISYFSFISDDRHNKLIDLQNNELGIILQEAINQLKCCQRDVIVLRLYADMSFAEIAKMTRVSINTSLGRMRYALINLRKNDQIKDYLDGLE